jgi:hypothetical protein
MIPDPLVERVLEKIARRSDEGMRKYGVTMERPDVTTAQWLLHAQEEAMDLAIYLQRCIEDIESH